VIAEAPTALPAEQPPTEGWPVVPGYEMLAELGRGGMGVVYQAQQARLDRFVAIKILPAEASRDPQFVERFSREARALAKLNHPNIITVHDFGQGGSHYYFVMEFVAGTDLRQRLRSGRLPPAEAFRIVGQVCDALHYAHQQGIVHRDIKPGNILLDTSGRVKVADFGIAKLLTAPMPGYTLTGPFQMMGTWHYMAPEQLDNPQGLDQRADIYSLGVMFYEMLTGKLPQGRFAPASQVAGVDSRMDDLILRALEPDPARRFQRVSDLKAALDNLVKEAHPVGPAASPFAGDAVGMPRAGEEHTSVDKTAPLAPGKGQAVAPAAEGVPSGYYLRTMLLAGLAWLLVPLLWNARELGLGLACGGVGGFIVWRARRAERFLPATAARWRWRPRWNHWVILPCMALISAGGVYLIFVACYHVWDRCNWNSGSRSADEFSRSYQGAEHRLLRRLEEFSREMPRADLLPIKNRGQIDDWPFGISSPPWSGNFSTLWICISLIIGTWLILATYHDLLRDRPLLPAGGWIPSYGRPTVWLTLTTIVPNVPLGIALLFAISGRTSSGFTFQAPSQLDLAAVVSRLEKWASENSCREGYSSAWKVSSIPQGEPLAEVQLRHYWRPNVFDRWQMTPKGLKRKGPDVVVEIVAGTKSKQVTVRLTSLPYGSEPVWKLYESLRLANFSR
jgi:hypothetical protein